jgi:nitroreductase
MDKPAEAQYPIHELMAKRWSPRSFLDRNVEVGKLRSCLEAARWAASCFNAQPWTYIVAHREDSENFERLADCLMPGNAWAKSAGVLVLAVASTTFAHNAQPNGMAVHDVGLANAQLVLQATAEGLSVHQMAGFDREKAREACSIPADHNPVAFLAVGYGGEPDQLSDELKERELVPRTRRPQTEFVFNGTWGESDL